MSNQEQVLVQEHESLAGSGGIAAVAVGSDPLSLTVVFTTVAATLEALRAASRLAGQFKARVRVLVPSVVPYALDITRPRVDPLFRLRHLRTLCQQDSVETFLDIRLCRDRLPCIREALAPRSLVLIGAQPGFWHRRAEERIVRELQRDGHDVTLVTSCSRGTIVSWYRTLSRKKR
jgi:hypothetical protein